MPSPSPHWSFLYSYHHFSVSVALMRPRCGDKVFTKPTAATNFRLGMEPVTKFSLQRSFLGGASSPEVEEQVEEERVGKRMGRVGGRWKEREGRGGEGKTREEGGRRRREPHRQASRLVL